MTKRNHPPEGTPENSDTLQPMFEIRYSADTSQESASKLVPSDRILSTVEMLRKSGNACTLIVERSEEKQ